MKTSIILTVRLTYEHPKHVRVAELTEHLGSAVNHLADNGLLTPDDSDAEATVEDYHAGMPDPAAAQMRDAARDLYCALLPLYDYCRTELRNCQTIPIPRRNTNMHEALVRAAAAIAKATT